MTATMGPIPASAFSDEAEEVAADVSNTCSYRGRDTDDISCPFTCAGAGTVSVNAGVNDDVDFSASAACVDGTADCGGTGSNHDCPQSADVQLTGEGVCSFHAKEFWDSGGWVTCGWNAEAESAGEAPECTWILEDIEVVCYTEDEQGRRCTYVADTQVTCTGPRSGNDPIITPRSFVTIAAGSSTGEFIGMACDHDYCTTLDVV